MRIVIIVLAAVMLVGCVTDRQDAKVDRTIEEREERVLLNERLTKLSAEVEVLSKRADGFGRELASVKDRLERIQAAGGNVAAAELQRLREEIAKLDAARQQDKQIILDEVAKQLDLIARRSGISTTRPGGGATETGQEHIVKAGETLSGIAKSHGVTVEALIKANNIKNPSALQVGQKLVIPKQ